VRTALDDFTHRGLRLAIATGKSLTELVPLVSPRDGDGR